MFGSLAAHGQRGIRRACAMINAANKREGGHLGISVENWWRSMVLSRMTHTK